MPDARRWREATPSPARFSLAATVLLTCGWACGCESPLFSRQSGTLTFPQNGGARGAAVMTEGGLEFRDRRDIPERVVVRDPGEPWRAPVGFILPASGRFTRTSHPTVLASQGVVIVLRPSDTRVPSWGGEILLRVDVHSPGPKGSARGGETIAVVIDGGGEEMKSLTEAAFGQLGASDTVTVVDARGARVVVPPMPATHRSLALAATHLRLDFPLGRESDLVTAIRLARGAVGTTGRRRLLVFTDHLPTESSGEIDAAAGSGVVVSVIGGGVFGSARTLDARIDAVRSAIPPAGVLQLKDLSLAMEATPSPTHVLEASGGDARWLLEGGELFLGDLRSGDARAEVLRVTVPPWIAGKRYALRVVARATDVSLGIAREFHAEIDAVYDDDIERIAESRHGDVIAYASALATLNRLHAAFVGDAVTHAGGLRRLARLHVDSLAAMAHDLPDRGFAEDAAVLGALLSATDAP